MKYLILISLFLTINACCKEPEPITICNVENPLEELAFLKEITINNKDVKVTHYKYENLEYINIRYLEEKYTEIFDCSGEMMCRSIPGNDFISEDWSSCDSAIANANSFIEYNLLLE